MPSIASLIPDPETVLALEPEELAGVVLEYLNALPPGESDQQLNRYNFGMPHTVQEYPQGYHQRLSEALMAAWVWLEREGLLAPKPGQSGEWVFITKRGRQMSRAADVEEYRRGSLLPKQLLHPVIAAKVVAPFLRGDYDTAVFQAFKEVEVAVRGAGSFAPTDIGVDLMRKAFHETTGPLTDMSVPVAERLALSHLLAGAIGRYKNPTSHRHVAVDAAEAVELIVMASHLLRIVESRSAGSGAMPTPLT